MAQANVTVGIKNGPFKNGLDSMRSQAQEWSSDIKSTIAGAFALGAITNFVSGFVSEMAHVKDMADRLGESSDTIQRVGNAAKLSGSDLKYVIENLKKMTFAAQESGEKFAKAGINADAFVNSSIEDKILMLAKAYEDAGDSQQKMIDLMAVLGPKGQDMLILLSQGATSLKDQMYDVAIASSNVVDAMANVDDAIETSKQKLTSWLSTAIDAFEKASVWVASFYYATGSDFNAQQLHDATLKAQKENSSPEQRNKDFKSEDKEGQRKKDEEARKAAEAGKRIDEEILDLTRSRMDAEQKIASLMQEQAKYKAASMDMSKPVSEQREAALKVLSLQKDIEAGQAEIAKKKKDEEDKAAKEKERKAKDVAKAEQNLADEQNRQKLEKMDPLARIKELKRQQKELNDAAAKEADPQAKAEKQLEALKLNDQIDSAMKEMDKSGKSKPAVISSSLASIGGGGGAYVGTDPALTESRKQTSILQEISRKLGTNGASALTQPRNPF